MTQEETDFLLDPELKNLYLKMLDYLSRGGMSEKRLVKRIVRLRQRYPNTERYLPYTKENAWRVIPLLREQGYINEREYAERVFESLRNKTSGLRLIQRKMLLRDIDPEIIQSVLSEQGETETPQDLTKITIRASAKYTRLLETEPNRPGRRIRIKQKMYQWLMMRGFTGEEIETILGNVMN